MPDRSKWRLVTLIHIAETREQARENVRFGLDAFRDYFRDVGDVPDRAARDRAIAYTFLMESGAACIGTPDDAIAYIENLLKGSGGFGAIMELAHNWADWEATKRHYELMARYVHPHFQRSRELRRKSYAYARDHHEEFIGQSAPRCRRRSTRWRRDERQSSWRVCLGQRR